MAIKWDLYNTRLNINGNTKRERDLYCLQNKITNNLPNSLSCKTVKINGIDGSLNFTETEKGYDIQSLPNENFRVGDYVEYETLTYLVTKVKGDKEVYTSGSMEECNYTLLFQSPTGTILSYPCIDDASSSIGIDTNSTISTLSGIHHIKLPYDDNTKLIGVNDRFFLDKVGITTYEVTNVNNTSFSYGDKGLIELTLQQDSAYNPQTDINGVCNYFEPTVTPIPPDPTTPTEIITITSDVENDNIKLGLVYTFSATFKNEIGETVMGVISQYSVNNSYGGLVILTDNHNGTCTVQVNEDAYNLLTNEFVLTCYDTVHGFSSSVILTIVGLF